MITQIKKEITQIKRDRLMQIKKIIKEATILFMIETFLLSTIISPTWAEENLFGNGYRDYLNNKIRNGYNLDTFMGLDRGQKEKIAKRRQIEELVDTSRWANGEINRQVQKDNLEKVENSQVLENEVAEQRKQREKNAAATGEFQYIAYADGKKEYFKDGLVATVENEKVTDEFGNVSRKDTRNMKYNDKRLLISYEATLADEFGSTTKIIFDGAQYSPDSVFYGNHVTRANKNLTKYHVREIDAGGNISDRYWQADKIEGKVVTTFSQKVLDPLYGNYSFQRSDIRYENNDPERIGSYHEEGIGRDGLHYTLDRTNMTYDERNQLTGYHEERTNEWGEKTVVDAKLKYIEDRFKESIITTTIENSDGSQRTEVTTTTYNYNRNNQIIGAKGSSQFAGQEADWYEYTDTQGHILSRNVDKDGNVTYSYGENVIVPQGQVIASLKDGNKYSGVSEIQFEILHGKPMAAKTDTLTSYYTPDKVELIRTDKTKLTYNNGLVNNLPRLINTQEHAESRYTQLDSQGNPQRGIRDITTTYIYAKNGNLIDAQGQGTGSGYELTNDGWMNYSSEIEADYGEYLGEVKQEKYKEVRDYGNGTKKQLTK